MIDISILFYWREFYDCFFIVGIYLEVGIKIRVVVSYEYNFGYL